MTQRSAHRHADRLRNAAAGFTQLDCTAARKRVRQLVTVGLAESQVGELVGWSLGDVRRACAEPHGALPAVKLVRDANE